MRWPNEKLGKIVGSGNRIKLRSYNVNFKRAVRNLKPSHVVSVENQHFLFYTFEVNMAPTFLAITIMNADRKKAVFEFK